MSEQCDRMACHERAESFDSELKTVELRVEWCRGAESNWSAYWPPYRAVGPLILARLRRSSVTQARENSCFPEPFRAVRFGKIL